MNHLLATLRSAAALLVIFTLLLGGVYPLLVISVAQIMFHAKANGSLIERDHKIVGSALLGQNFDSPRYFWGRPSATTPPYNPASSAGSNLSIGNPKLAELAAARAGELQKMAPADKNRIPVELVSASASGLDPHITVAAVMYQLPRVAKARGMSEQALRDAVEPYIEQPLEFMGEAYVNFVRLNLALDEISHKNGK